MSLIRRDAFSSPSCYTLNGQKTPSDGLSYIPCNTTAIANGQHSSCCASSDLCLSNGLCKYNAPANARPFNEYWRVGCTDPTYKDPACPKQCADIPNQKPTHLVFQCPGNGRWCCGTGQIETYKDRGTVNTTCCGIDNLAFDGGVANVFTTASLDLKMNFETTKTSAAGIGSATSMPTPASAPLESGGLSSLAVAPSSFPTSNSPAKPPSRASIEVTTAVGIGVGVPLAIAVIIGFFLVLVLRQRRRERSNPLSDSALSSASRFSFWKDTPPAPIVAQQTPSNSRGYAFWRRKPEQSLSPASIDNPDIRATNPHAFWNEAQGREMAEAQGREMAAELDALRPPVEASSPDAEVTPGPREGANADMAQRMSDIQYGFGSAESERKGLKSPTIPEIPSYTHK